MMPPLPGLPPGAGTPAGPPPPELLAALAGGPDQGPPPPDQAGGDPFQLMQQWLQDTHALIASLPDPQDTAIMSQCLAQGSKIQARMMQAQQGAGDARQALTRQLGGAAGAY